MPIVDALIDLSPDHPAYPLALHLTSALAADPHCLTVRVEPLWLDVDSGVCSLTVIGNGRVLAMPFRAADTADDLCLRLGWALRATAPPRQPAPPGSGHREQGTVDAEPRCHRRR